MATVPLYLVGRGDPSRAGATNLTWIMHTKNIMHILAFLMHMHVCAHVCVHVLYKHSRCVCVCMCQCVCMPGCACTDTRRKCQVSCSIDICSVLLRQALSDSGTKVVDSQPQQFSCACSQHWDYRCILLFNRI